MSKILKGRVLHHEYLRKIGIPTTLVVTPAPFMTLDLNLLISKTLSTTLSAGGKGDSNSETLLDLFLLDEADRTGDISSPGSQNPLS